jgi:Zn-dependent peptidase ImmA (M78 family)/transcriptional regulator with XRE-family HTH domain
MIGERIRQWRLARGLTQTEVVQKLENAGVALTKAGLSKYERSGSTPKPTMLLRLAEVFETKVENLVSETTVRLEWVAFRKLPTLTQRDAERAKCAALAVVESQLWLLSRFRPTEKPRFPNPVRVSSFEDAEVAAQTLRAKWRLDENPIESVTETVEDNGGIVVFIETDARDFHGLSGWANSSVPVVVSRADAEADRCRFNVAHEIGHLVMTCPKSSPAEAERLAHRFAAAFIVPSAVVRRELGTRRKALGLDELALLKQKHGLSMQAWAYRAADLGIVDQRFLRSFFIEMNARGWRRQEPFKFEGHEQPAKLRQLTLRALAEGVVTRDKAEALCPGSTEGLSESGTKKEPARLTAREIIKLPLPERDRLLAEGAAVVQRDYAESGPMRRFDAFEGDETHAD